MNKYKVYVTFYGKKMMVRVQANSPTEARQKVINNLQFNGIASDTDSDKEKEAKQKEEKEKVNGKLNTLFKEVDDLFKSVFGIGK